MINTVSTIHALLSNTIWLFFLALGVWGLVRALRKQGLDGGYVGAMFIGEGLYILQGLLGAVLWSSGLLAPLDRPEIHVLYGAFAVVFMPFVYFVWLKGDDSNRAQWAMALATLFLFGVALRAITSSV